MKKQLPFIMVALIGFLAITLILRLTGKDEQEPNKPKPVTNSNEVVTIDDEYIPTSDVPIESYSETIPEADTSYAEESNGVSYWYVYFNVNDEYEGYKVIKLDCNYFDISKAIERIKPDAKDGDFVGISFFSEVSEPTYQSYIKNK